MNWSQNCPCGPQNNYPAPPSYKWLVLCSLRQSVFTHLRPEISKFRSRSNFLLYWLGYGWTGRAGNRVRFSPELKSLFFKTSSPTLAASHHISAWINEHFYQWKCTSNSPYACVVYKCCVPNWDSIKQNLIALVFTYEYNNVLPPFSSTSLYCPT